MKLVGQSYLFRTDLPYAKKHDGKEITIIETNGHVSICETEEGEKFAAFNTELKYSLTETVERASFQQQRDSFPRDRQNQYNQQQNEATRNHTFPRKQWAR